jgi:hypothetical protein
MPQEARLRLSLTNILRYFVTDNGYKKDWTTVQEFLLKRSILQKLEKLRGLVSTIDD